jgi:antitoxin component of MazEF toxin-antitoxin module
VVNGLALTIEVKIAKMGNSLRMTIPVPVARVLELKDGDTVEVGVLDGAMIVKRIVKKAES